MTTTESLPRDTASTTDHGRWTIIRAASSAGDVRDIMIKLAGEYGVEAPEFASNEPNAAAPQSGLITVRFSGSAIRVRWRCLPTSSPTTLDAPSSSSSDVVSVEIMVELEDATSELGRRWFDELVIRLDEEVNAFTDSEAHTIRDAMPLLRRYSGPEPALAGWSLIFRDHYVENGVGFLQAMERAGIPPSRVLAMAKGDRTKNRQRMHAYLRRRGYISGVLDQAAYEGDLGPGARAGAQEMLARIDGFIRAEHAEGRKVLAIDEGGLVISKFGGGQAGPAQIDAGIELTVSGVNRVQAAGVTVPVLNVARCALKACSAYPAIADSCVRRLRTILPGETFLGRDVLVIGFGTMGARIAQGLRSLSCRVSVTDTDTLALIRAAEQGFTTYRSVKKALHAGNYFLLVGGSGQPSLSEGDLDLLQDGAFLAAFATKDFAVLTNDLYTTVRSAVRGLGTRCTLRTGAKVMLLGDGRSLNLFETEGIPNGGFDAFRAGTLLAAKYLCRDVDQLPPGLQTEPVDNVIRDSGLLDSFYDRYLVRA